MSAEERAAILAPTTDFSTAERYEQLSGGTATNKTRLDRNAFSQPSANLDFAARGDFFVGNGFFKRLWVTAPSSTRSADGLGPVYNARACQRCHLKDGRGHPPAGPDDNAVSMFLRLSIPPQTDAQRAAIDTHEMALVPEPTYGTQLQDFAIPGHAAEGRIMITYTEEPVELAGGEIVSLRRPEYSIAEPAYGALHPDLLMSPRIAQPMIGLGLLEAIDPSDILAAADPDDADGDGISGRANLAWSSLHQDVMLGRFGWKAGKPTIPDRMRALRSETSAACASCHTESYCIQCHAAEPSAIAAPINPHPSNWLDICGAAMSRNQTACLKCHSAGDVLLADVRLTHSEAA